MPRMLGRKGQPQVLLDAIGSWKFTLVVPLGPGPVIPTYGAGGSGTPGSGGTRQGAGRRLLSGTQKYSVFKIFFMVG